MKVKDGVALSAPSFGCGQTAPLDIPQLHRDEIILFGRTKGVFCQMNDQSQTCKWQCSNHKNAVFHKFRTESREMLNEFSSWNSLPNVY